MKCETAQQNIVLVTYGELPDEQMASLELHLADCEDCSRELKALLAMHEALAYRPMHDPSPNLLAHSRMRLDEELDAIPPHGFLTRLRTNLYTWLGHLQPAAKAEPPGRWEVEEHPTRDLEISTGNGRQARGSGPSRGSKQKPVRDRWSDEDRREKTEVALGSPASGTWWIEALASHSLREEDVEPQKRC